MGVGEGLVDFLDGWVDIWEYGVNVRDVLWLKRGRDRE